MKLLSALFLSLFLFPISVTQGFNSSNPLAAYNYPGSSWSITAPFPNLIWVNAFNGDVPKKAVIYENPRDPQLLYYCRGQYNDQLIYGQLVPGKGCYFGDPAKLNAILLSSYQVLIDR